MPRFERFPAVADHVIYRDERGRPNNALLTAVWGVENEHNDCLPCCNLVFVSSDENRKDGYGRQTERESSVVHKSHQAAHGNYWHFPEEEPNPRVKAQT